VASLYTAYNVDVGKTAFVLHLQDMDKRRNVNLDAQGNEPPCVCGFFAAHRLDCRHAMSYLIRLGKMKNTTDYIRERVPRFYWWSNFCEAYKDAVIITPNLAEIEKVVEVIVIEAEAAAGEPVVRNPPIIKKSGVSKMKRIPNAGDTSQAPSQGSSKRPYIRKAAGTTTAATPGLETYEAGRPKRKGAGSHSTKFGTEEDDDLLAPFMETGTLVVEDDLDDMDGS